MAQVDIPVPESLREALSAPICLDLSLPKPQKLTINLPSGAALTSLSNIGQNIPNDCSLTFSLMLQIMPMMASMECVLKILKLLKPLSDAVTSPPPTPKLIEDIVEGGGRSRALFPDAHAGRDDPVRARHPVPDPEGSQLPDRTVEDRSATCSAGWRSRSRTRAPAATTSSPRPSSARSRTPSPRWGT